MAYDEFSSTESLRSYAWRQLKARVVLRGAKIVRKALRIPGIRAITPDSWYLRAIYRIHTGKRLRLNPPRGFNEKIQWLKLRRRDPRFARLVDKLAVREYVAETIGAEYLVPHVAGPWRKAEEIDFDALPERFVLKCNHDSGGVVVCADKSRFDREAACRKLTRNLKKNFYWPARETPYRHIKPLILCEEYLEDDSEEGLRDYKVYVFNGKTRFILVCSRRFTSKEGLHVTFYDLDWNVLPFREKLPTEKEPEPRPEGLEKMLDFSERLAKSLLFARVDFYVNRGRIYFGEITLYPTAGLELFVPDEWEEKIGDMLNLEA